MKKGFTLVEILAVIVVLAIILVIAVPKVNNIIIKQKKGVLEANAKTAARNLEVAYRTAKLAGNTFSLSGDCPESIYDSNESTCTYQIDEVSNTFNVTLMGKDDSKFKGLAVLNATKNTAVAIKYGAKVTVTFDSQGGSTINSINATSGMAYGTLPVPTKTNSAFKGWYTATSGGTKITNTSIVEDDITLYAQYKDVVELSTSWKTTINGKTVDTLKIVSTGSSSNIKSIKFYDNADNVYDTTGKTFIANVSKTGETIKAYGVVDSTDTTKIDIDIVGDSLIAFPSYSNQLFYNLTNLNVLDFNDSITTSNVTDMSYMFYNCSLLTSLDVSNFDTSNVKPCHKRFTIVKN